MFLRLLSTLVLLTVGFVAGANWPPSSRPAADSIAVGSVHALAAPTRSSALHRSIATAECELRGPSLVRDTDGLLTGSFARVTPEWLLAMLERAGVVSPRATTYLAAQSPTALAEERSGETAPVAHDAVLQQLRSGSEAERLAALTKLVDEDLPIPPRDLVDTFQSSADDRLALFAFTLYVESVAEDAGTAREALQRGMESGNAAVREDAARRMLELEHLVQVENSIAAQGLQ
jgi:hypothetical protein